MIKFSFISAFSILTVFSQETESSLINNNDTLNVAIQKTDSLEVDTTEASLNDVMNSIDINTNEQVNDKADTLNTAKPLPIVRDPDKKTIEKLESGEQFFEIKSSIDVLRQQVDSLKKIISVYEEGKGAMPNINEELLDLIKIPQLRHRIELQNGTVVNGEIIEEDDLGIIVQTSIGQLAIEKDKIIDIGEDLPPLAKVEIINEPFVDIYTDREEITGALKNIGTKRADFVRVIANLWSPTTQLLYQDSVFVSGQNTKYYTGIKSITSLDPGSITEFKMTIPVDSEDEVSYRTYEVRWESYK
ncbi:MAG: hypothetical protein ACJZ15_00375 [Candidatus Neomarinimicrobiota bacterium]|nr:MAG: hypothetical protein DBW60_01150 [bacterium]|tara:strand:- start:9595 stop:10500 length:906 start_codon:yes stop_codon:yes gene_type:complete